MTMCKQCFAFRWSLSVLSTRTS